MPGIFKFIALSLLVAVFAIALPRSVRADGPCDAPTAAWARACATEQHVDMTAASCPASVVIIELRPDGAQSFSVELSRRAGAFRHAGGIGLSPIGQFPDWSSEPRQRRAALDALAACVAAHTPEALLDTAPPPPSAEQVSATPIVRVPWLLLAAALTLAAALLAARTPLLKPRKAIAWTAAAIASIAIVVLVRRALLPIQFLHQNGQGPLWIQFALEGNARPYGPGWPEVFHWIVRGAARPDTALILAQELAAAVVPLGFFLGARALGLRPAVAAMVAAIVALDPICIRMARSESYLATIFTLLSLAAAALMSCSSPGIQRRSVVRALTFVGAGLLVAQATRIHPLGWVPAAPLPLILLIGRDTWRRRLIDVALATTAIAVVVAATSLAAMLATLHGSLGQTFLPSAGALVRAHVLAALLHVGLASLLFAPRRTRPFALPVLVIVLVLEATSTTGILSAGSSLVDAAYQHCFLPVIAAGAARLLSHERLSARRAGAILAPLFVLHAVFEWRSMKTPTDAAEQAWCQQWRETLPSNAEVTWLELAGKRVLELPIHGTALPLTTPFRPEGVPQFRGRGPRYYYRGSLCSTPDGAGYCAAFEQTHQLRLIAQRSLPAIASLRWLPLPEGPVVVQLFAVE